jgi:dihydroorotate dehydrogenase (NAD+) catalytic subunit
VRPVAVRCVWQVHRAFPGPADRRGRHPYGRDALEFLAAGATAVQVGTAIFNDPSAPMRVVRELGDELGRRGLTSPAEIVGIAHR